MAIEIEKEKQSKGNGQGLSGDALSVLAEAIAKVKVTPVAEPPFVSEYEGVDMNLYCTSPGTTILLREAPSVPVSVYNPKSGQMESQVQDDIVAKFSKTWVAVKVVAESSGGDKFRVPGTKVCGHLDLRDWFAKNKKRYDLKDFELDRMWEKITSPNAGFGREHGTLDMLDNLFWGIEGKTKKVGTTMVDMTDQKPKAIRMKGKNYESMDEVAEARRTAR